MKNKLTVTQQVPEFVRSEYPAFVEFLQAYYEWLEEEYSVGRLGDLINIDTTIDSFLKYFRKQLDIHGVTANTNDRFYIKNLKELYTSKGSSASAEFLFKILYNTTSKVTQPWDSVIKSSQAEWKQDISILTTSIDETTAETLVGNKIIITDASGYQYTTYVTDMNARESGVIELFINRIAPRDTIKTFVSYDQTVNGTILSSIVSVNVDRPGTGFKPGQVFKVDNGSNIDSTYVKVKDVSSIGGISSVEVITFGAGYTQDFSVNYAPDQDLATRRTRTFTFNPNTAVNYSTGEIGTSVAQYFTTGDSVVFYRGGSGYNSIPGATGSDGVLSSGILNNNKYYVIAGATSVKLAYTYSNAINGKYVPIAQGATGISSSTTLFVSDYATLTFKIDNLCVYKGRYNTGFDIVGELAYLQDSYYYQLYSYVTSLDHAIDDYGALLKRVLHPAGTKHFANLEIRNAFNFNIGAITSLSVVEKNNGFNDYVSQLVEVLAFAISKAIADSTPVTEQLILSVTKGISDQISTVSDTHTLTIQPSYSDNITQPTETRTLTIQPSYSDNITQPTETYVFKVTSVYSDTFTLAENTAFTVQKPGITDSITSFAESVITQLSKERLATDSFSISDGTVTLTPAKYITDAIDSLTNSGTIYGGPFYTETPYINQYWQNGYLLNEALITN